MKRAIAVLAVLLACGALYSAERSPLGELFQLHGDTILYLVGEVKTLKQENEALERRVTNLRAELSKVQQELGHDPGWHGDLTADRPADVDD